MTELHPGTVIAGRYRVGAPLGAGGFATVVAAEQLSTGQRVALKIMHTASNSLEHTELVARFERETRLIARLRHPNIVRLIDGGSLDDGTLYTALELVDGETLDQRLARLGPLTLDETFRVMTQVLDALVCAHGQGVIHRDIKPSNIMVFQAGARPKAMLLDFGIAAVTGAARLDERTLTQRGTFLGTPAYSAPELITGGSASPASDLYSWALVFVECLTGKRVFGGSSFAQVVMAQLRGGAVTLPEAIAAHPLGELLGRALKRSEAERFATAAALFEALTAIDVSALGGGSAAEPARAAPVGAVNATLALSQPLRPSSSAPPEALIGRQHELGLLLERWGHAQDGLGAAALVTGEPGIGKSRLLEAVKAKLSPAAKGLLWGGCLEERRDSPLHPILEALAARIGLDGLARDERLPAMRAFVADCGLDEVSVALLARLLGLAWPGPDPTARLDARERRRRALETTLSLLASLAERAPMLLVIEDLHWADPSTLELLATLAEEVSTLPVLLLMSSREGPPEALSAANLIRLSLSPLSDDEVIRLAEAVAGELNPQQRAWLEQASDGVPLFAEELARALLDGDLPADASPSQSLVLSSRLEHLLKARLDALGETRAVALKASVLGREFPLHLLMGLWDGAVAALQAGLERMVRRGFLRRRGLGGQVRYQFRHQLIRDASYAALPREEAVALHRALVRSLEREEPALLADQPELAAHHLAAAGDLEEAAGWALEAARRAARGVGSREVIAHTDRGIRWLNSLPGSARQRSLGLELRAAKIPALFATQSYGSQEAEATLVETLQLSQALPGSGLGFQLRWGLWICLTAQGRHREAIARARELLTVAGEDAALVLEAKLAIGHSCYYLPELEEGLGFLNESLALYDPERHRDHLLRYGQDPAVMGMAFSAVMLWLRGFADQSLARVAQGLAHAEALKHPMSLAMMRCMSTVVRQLRREPGEARQAADALVSHARAHGLPYWEAIGRVYGTWARAMQGEPAVGAMREAVAAFEQTGSSNNLTVYLGMLAEVELRAGQVASALEHLERAEALMVERSERRMEAELHRVHAAALLATPDLSDARGAARERLARALETAEAQGARALALRAALDLEKLSRGTGEEATARARLQAALDALPEGRDTRDQQDAINYLYQNT